MIKDSSNEMAAKYSRAMGDDLMRHDSVLVNTGAVTGVSNSVSLLLRVAPFKITNVYGPCYACYGCYGFLERGRGGGQLPVG